MAFRPARSCSPSTVRRLAAHRGGRTPGTELFAGSKRLLDELAAGLGLDQWVAVWDKLTALSVQVDRLNLDPAQALMQVMQ